MIREVKTFTQMILGQSIRYLSLREGFPHNVNKKFKKSKFFIGDAGFDRCRRNALNKESGYCFQTILFPRNGIFGKFFLKRIRPRLGLYEAISNINRVGDGVLQRVYSMRYS